MEHIKYYKEIESVFADLFRESWMDEGDWREFMDGVTERGVIAQMSDAIQTGIDKGFELENQLAMVRYMFKPG